MKQQECQLPDYGCDFALLVDVGVVFDNLLLMGRNTSSAKVAILMLVDPLYSCVSSPLNFDFGRSSAAKLLAYTEIGRDLLASSCISVASTSSTSLFILLSRSHNAGVQ